MANQLAEPIRVNDIDIIVQQNTDFSIGISNS
jgi:hypothetical protein